MKVALFLILLGLKSMGLGYNITYIKMLPFVYVAICLLMLEKIRVEALLGWDSQLGINSTHSTIMLAILIVFTTKL